jgi:hypothetical protein
MNYQNILLLLIVLGVCNSFNELNHSILAASPSVSFSIQNIVEEPHPRYNISADYYSDGKTLNATIWLPSHLGQAGLRFGMAISIGGNVKPIVYYDMYLQNEHNGTSTSNITQSTLTSPPNAANPLYANRSLDAMDAFTGSYGK